MPVFFFLLSILYNDISYQLFLSNTISLTNPLTVFSFYFS